MLVYRSVYNLSFSEHIIWHTFLKQNSSNLWSHCLLPVVSSFFSPSGRSHVLGASFNQDLRGESRIDFEVRRCWFGWRTWHQSPVQNVSYTTVDGRILAPVDMVNIPLCTGFYTSQVVQDFFHQTYNPVNCRIFRYSPFFLVQEETSINTITHGKGEV